MGKNDYEISLRNCRNVKSVAGGGPLIIKKNALNVFYGRNGTGKSTVGLAIRHAFEKTDETLKPLESYGFKDSADPALAPIASCSTKIRGLHVFDDEWVSSHCFAKGTLQSDAYELYVRDTDVRKLEKRRRDKLGMLSKVLLSGEVEALRGSLAALQKGLGRLKANGEFKASAPVVKAFESGVPTEPVPAELRSVVRGMTAKEKAQWLSWHTDDRRPTLRNEAVCPFCGNEDAARLKSCRGYDESRNQGEVKQWAAIADMYDSVGSTLSRSNAALLGKVLNRKTPPEKQEVDALAALADDVATALAALDKLSDMLRDEEYVDISKLVPALRVESSRLVSCGIFLKTRQGAKTAAWRAIELIGRAVSAVAVAQAELEALTKDLVAKVAANISGHEAEINSFLAQCGYLYEVEIRCNPQASEASVLLKPTGTKNRLLVEDPASALSYGERNALALALFMFEAVSDPQSLVVLDDPISSFDFDKRYGILYALFSKDGGVFRQNLCGRSVLVMTHDFLVVNDLVNIPGKGMAAKGNLLTCEEGILSCKPLTGDAIAPYTQILKRKIRESADVPLIVRLVYVRQLCEMLRKGPKDKSTKEGWTFGLLSDVIHARSASEVMKANGFQTKDAKWVAVCENHVGRLTGVKISYWDTLERYGDCMPELIAECRKPGRSPMEKLILVRLMIMRDGTLGEDSNIMKRFADETCHIGGSYLFQLDDGAYDQVPFYVLKWCDEVAAKAEAGCVGGGKG